MDTQQEGQTAGGGSQGYVAGQEGAKPPEGQDSTQAVAITDEVFYADERFKAFQSTSNKQVDGLKNDTETLRRQIEDLADVAEARSEAGSPDDQATRESEQRRVEAVKQLRTRTRELEARGRELDERQNQMNQQELNGAAERFSKEYGVPRHKLLELGSAKDMELYALRNKVSAANGQDTNKPQLDRGGGGNAQTTGAPSGLRGVDRIEDWLKNQSEGS
jgi:hypothetical protein